MNCSSVRKAMCTAGGALRSVLFFSFFFSFLAEGLSIYIYNSYLYQRTENCYAIAFLSISL